MPIRFLILKGKKTCGINGFALAPAKHFRKCYSYQSSYDFYFRPEIQISSEEGLNAYGITWGNFIYQGFNENCGWMHT
jgi:hypothetical protein